MQHLDFVLWILLYPLSQNLNMFIGVKLYGDKVTKLNNFDILVRAIMLFGIGYCLWRY